MTTTLGAVSLSILSIATPAYLVSTIADSGRSDAWMLTLGVMIWAGFRLSVLVTRGRAHLFDVFFWLYSYIFLGLAPTAQIRSDQISLTTPGMDPDLDTPTALIVVLGIALYEVGRLVARGHAAVLERAAPVPDSAADAERGPDRGPDAVRRPRRSISLSRTSILFAIGATIAAYYVWQVGFAFFQGTRDAGIAAREAAWADPAIRAGISIASLYPVLVALGALLQLRTQVHPIAKRWVVAAAVVCVVLIFSVVSPVSSARYTFGTVAFALAVYAGALSTALRVRVTMIATFLGLLFVFPLADAFRRTGQEQESRAGFFEEYVGNPDYDSFWQIANAYSYFSDGLVEPLRQYLGSVLFWVPRSVWPTKPTDTGVLLADYRGYSFDNLSAPLWAEALVNGGFVALVFTFLVVGYTVCRLDLKIGSVVNQGGVWMLVAAVFPVYTTILLRGSLLQATGVLIVTAACVLFVRAGRAERSQPKSQPDSQPAYADSN